jgi:hypothetical protein
VAVDRRLDLQYRDRLEFAIGRTCSVDWDAAPGTRQARAVWTTWLPTAETPQTRPGEVAEALLSMDALSRVDGEWLIVSCRSGWLAWRAAGLPLSASWSSGPSLS